MTNPTVGDLIHSLDKQSVLDRLASLYTGDGESPEGYDQMWDTLKGLQPKLTDTSAHLSRQQCLSGKQYIHVSGIVEGDPQHWAIEFVDWREWLSMPIVVSDELQPMSQEEQLAHCLYEMSWAGYTREDIQARLDVINDVVEDVEDMLESLPKPH